MVFLEKKAKKSKLKKITKHVIFVRKNLINNIILKIFFNSREIFFMWEKYKFNYFFD